MKRSRAVKRRKKMSIEKTLRNRHLTLHKVGTQPKIEMQSKGARVPLGTLEKEDNKVGLEVVIIWNGKNVET